ncbi:MAG: hypothetical protein OK454_07060, partial [Thaumarchaeota archaeon]|nr:hypothetical protein [Nitrososphaerota archaeon]
MDAGVLDVALALGGELLAQVGRVLVLDVLDDGVPAAVVVDQVTVAGGVDDVKPEPDAVLLDDVRNGVDLGRRTDDLLGLQTALGLDQVRGEDGVDQGRLAQTSLAWNGGGDIYQNLEAVISGGPCPAQGAPEETDGWGTPIGTWDELAGEPTNADDVELEATLKELALDLGGDAVETDVALGVDGSSRHG